MMLYIVYECATYTVSPHINCWTMSWKFRTRLTMAALGAFRAVSLPRLFELKSFVSSKLCQRLKTMKAIGIWANLLFELGEVLVLIHWPSKASQSSNPNQQWPLSGLNSCHFLLRVERDHARLEAKLDVWVELGHPWLNYDHDVPVMSEELAGNLIFWAGWKHFETTQNNTQDEVTTNIQQKPSEAWRRGGPKGLMICGW